MYPTYLVHYNIYGYTSNNDLDSIIVVIFMFILYMKHDSNIKQLYISVFSSEAWFKFNIIRLIARSD